MHSTREITSSDFNFTLFNQLSSFEDVFQDFNSEDRLGIIVHSNGGSIGATTLLMSAITKFYDFYRSKLGNEEGKLRIYPEYFVFHIGKRRMNHHFLEIHPSYKEVVVDNDANTILNMLNAYGITRLLVEEIDGTDSELLRESYNSASYRIKTSIAYNLRGRSTGIQCSVKGPAIIENYIRSSLKRATYLDVNLYDKYRDTNEKGIIEFFLIISLDEALCMLQSKT